MVKLYNQISLSDTFQECNDAYQNDKPKFPSTGLIIKPSGEIESIP